MLGVWRRAGEAGQAIMCTSWGGEAVRQSGEAGQAIICCGVPGRRDQRGRHVHERGGGGEGRCAGQVRLVRSSCAGRQGARQARPVRPSCARGRVTRQARPPCRRGRHAGEAGQAIHHDLGGGGRCASQARLAGHHVPPWVVRLSGEAGQYTMC